jgi:tight adherence protein C
MELLGPEALAFTATAVLALLLLAFVTMFRRDPDADQEPVPRLLGPLTKPVGALLPMTAQGREETRKDLLRAGYYEPVALDNFNALRSLLTFGPLLAGLIPAVLTVGNVAFGFFVVGVMGGLIGYLTPRVILAIQAENRQEAVRRGLPMLMDTLALNVSTGASLPEALEASGQALERGYPELGREVKVVTAHSRLRGLTHALEAWKERLPIPELASLVYLLTQSDRMGTDVTKGLWELSSSLQVNSRQRAEAAANRTSFYMVFPTVLCLTVAAGLLLAGPGIVQLAESKQELDRTIQQAEQQRQVIDRGRDGRYPTQTEVPVTTAPQPEPPPRN